MQPRRHRFRARHTAPLFVACLALIALAVPALAAHGGGFKGVAATGKTQRGRFVGTVSVSRFSVKSSKLVATVVVAGTVTDARYPGPVTFSQPGIPLVVKVGGSGCARTVALGPTRTYIWGLPGTLAAHRVKLSHKAGCRLNSAHGAGAQAAALNAIRRTNG